MLLRMWQETNFSWEDPATAVSSYQHMITKGAG